LVLICMQNRTFGPYLAAIFISVKHSTFQSGDGPESAAAPGASALDIMKNGEVAADGPGGRLPNPFVLSRDWSVCLAALPGADDDTELLQVDNAHVCLSVCLFVCL
jgi:hypothetical protein